MAAVPSIGRASRVEGAPAPEADLTRALYEQYATQIFRYCLHQLGSREEAEDAVQSTFLNAFRGIKRGVEPEIESAWLFKIAHNVCLSRRRSSWRRDRIESPADFEVIEETTPAPSRRADELIGLQDVLEQMPEQQRRAILLREWQGLSYREIGDELALSQAAVETLIFRARRSLAQGLEQPVAVETKKRKRLLAAGALGNLLSSAQSFLLGGGAAAVKVAAVVAVAGAGAVVATDPLQHHAPAGHSKSSKQHAAPARAHHSTSSTVVRSVPVVVAPIVAPVHAQPQTPAPAVTPPRRATAPGQLKKENRDKGTAPVANPGRETAPGQLKKESGNASTGPAPAVARHGRETAPGQLKKDGAMPATAPAQGRASGDQGSHGRDGAPGRQKKALTEPAAPASATPAPDTLPAASHGNGHGADNGAGEGNGNGADNGHGDNGHGQGQGNDN